MLHVIAKARPQSTNCESNPSFSSDQCSQNPTYSEHPVALTGHCSPPRSSLVQLQTQQLSWKWWQPGALCHSTQLQIISQYKHVQQMKSLFLLTITRPASQQRCLWKALHYFPSLFTPLPFLALLLAKQHYCLIHVTVKSCPCAAVLGQNKHSERKLHSWSLA